MLTQCKCVYWPRKPAIWVSDSSKIEYDFKWQKKLVVQKRCHRKIEGVIFWKINIRIKWNTQYTLVGEEHISWHYI